MFCTFEFLLGEKKKRKKKHLRIFVSQDNKVTRTKAGLKCLFTTKKRQQYKVKGFLYELFAHRWVSQTPERHKQHETFVSQTQQSWDKIKKEKKEMLEFTRHWMPTFSTYLEPFLWHSFLQIWEKKLELKLYTSLLWLLITRLTASQHYLCIIITLALLASVICYIKHR